MNRCSSVARAFLELNFLGFFENSRISKILAILANRNAFGVAPMNMTKAATPHGISTVQPALMSSHTYPKLKEFLRLDPTKVAHPLALAIDPFLTKLL